MRSLAVATTVVALVACTPDRTPEPVEIETVDVGGPVDVDLSTAEDEKGAPPADSGWILSGGLPEDLPLHRPARLVGSGETEDGREFFVFHTATRLDTVRAGLGDRLAADGWSTRPSASLLVATRGAERAEYHLAPLEPGTEIRVVY